MNNYHSTRPPVRECHDGPDEPLRERAWTDAQIEAFRKDAARYRWLRTSADISWNGWVTYQNLAAYEFERAGMDAAIDAAMQGATP